MTVSPTWTVQQIKAQVRLEDVIRRRGVELRGNQSGERMEGQCPFHAYDQTPSFNVYISNQRYHCFGCGADGDVIDFVQAFDVCSFSEAMRRLASNVVPLPTTQLLRHRTPRPVLPVPFPVAQQDSARHELLTHVHQHYHQTLLTHTPLLERLQRERGITKDGIQLCGLGYADGTCFSRLELPASRLQQAQGMGLLSPQGSERMLGRLTIPECMDEDCAWMIGRSLQPYRQGYSRRLPKYLGLSLTKPLLGYGLALQRLRARELVRGILVVEGAIDYVLAVQWKLPVLCVALVGTHASRRQLSLLLDVQRRSNAPFLLALDADEAGQQASVHLLAQLQRAGARSTVLAPVAQAKDIGDLGTQAGGRTLLTHAIERTLAQGERQ
ncbi:CHC2 zinc finger domain-containing protein [Dictyobacter formicarum]|uniref:Zinc finger CHC2-type domain-containing protein n=1 Tax=Dictyobacter formicarum TaxID=2778368 RepID=A0ABQ3VPH7_9CHLR|nr:CHC2 zinc finger domain-containing protein [Dictyobacter formicarum]GHO88154.1 hypothetical protein KSZ_61600 [Dictyobacter formicarum]